MSHKSIYTEIFRFALVGLAGSALNYAVFYILLVHCNLYYLIAGILGFLTPIPLVYVINRTWTFGSNIGHRKGMPAYVMTNIVAMLAHFVAQIFAGEFIGVAEKFTQIFGIASSAIVNFTLAKFFVFQRK